MNFMQHIFQNTVPASLNNLSFPCIYIFLKRPGNALGCTVNTEMFWPIMGHLQDGMKKNTNTIIMCRNQSTFKRNIQFLFKIYGLYSTLWTNIKH